MLTNEAEGRAETLRRIAACRAAGTHAPFLKSRAVFPLVWTPKSEAKQFHTHGGFTFRNQPLAYWLAYVRTFGGARSPVLVIQAQCDRSEAEARFRPSLKSSAKL